MSDGVYRFGSMKVQKSRIQTINRKDLHVIDTTQQTSTLNNDKLTQEQIKKAVPEQLQRQIFNLELQNGQYVLDYDYLGQFLVLGSSQGHLALIRLRDFQLIQERLYGENFTKIKFLNTSNVIAAASGRRALIFDQNLLQLHVIEAGIINNENNQEAKKTSSLIIELLFLREFMLLCVVWRDELRYVDITNGNVVKRILFNFSAVSAALDIRTGVVAVSGADSGVIHYFAPAFSSPLASYATGLAGVGQVQLYAMPGGPQVVVAVQGSAIRLMDGYRDFLGVLFTIEAHKTVENFIISQSGVACVALGGELVFFNLKKTIQQFFTSNINKNDQNSIQNVFNNTENSFHITKRSRKAAGEERIDIESLIVQRHRLQNSMKIHIAFRNFFDDLGIAGTSFQQILVPGSGEVKIDFYNSNVYQSTRQRSEQEVKQQLYKLDYQLIGTDLLVQKDNVSEEEAIRRRYDEVFASMNGKFRTRQRKSLRAKQSMRQQKIQANAEIKALAAQLKRHREAKNIQDQTLTDNATQQDFMTMLRKPGHGK